MKIGATSEGSLQFAIFIFQFSIFNVQRVYWPPGLKALSLNAKIYLLPRDRTALFLPQLVKHRDLERVVIRRERTKHKQTAGDYSGRDRAAVPNQNGPSASAENLPARPQYPSAHFQLRRVVTGGLGVVDDERVNEL